jgi:hypothetical protein
MAKKFQTIKTRAELTPAMPEWQEVIGGFDTREAAKDYAHQTSMNHGGLYSVRENPNYMDELIEENTVALALRDAARRERRAKR